MAALAASASSVILIAASPAPLVFDRIVLVSRFISCSRKSSFLPIFAAGFEQLGQLPGMDLQPRQFFADVAAIGQYRRFLRQPLRIHLDALEQFLQAIGQARF